MRRRFCWSAAAPAVAAAPTGVAQFAAVPQSEVVQPFEAVPPIVAERSFEGAQLSPVAADIMAADIVIRTINIAVAPAMPAAFIVAGRRFIVAVRTQEAVLLPAVALSEAEAHMSPTAVVDAGANIWLRPGYFGSGANALA